MNKIFILGLLIGFSLSMKPPREDSPYVLKSPNENVDIDNESKEVKAVIKPYKRDELIKLPESENKIFNIEQSKILENKFGIDKIKEFLTVNLSYLSFYHYNCESVNDRDWGCAWRSMQTVLRYGLSLSNQNKDISFYNLFMKYGDKNTLIDIFKKMKKKQVFNTK